MDANRRSRYGWMGLGAMVCLFVVVMAFKLRDGNKAHAQTPMDGPDLPEPMLKAEKASAPPAPLPPVVDATTLPPPGDVTPPPPLAGKPLPEIKVTAGEVPIPPPSVPGALPPVTPPTGSEGRPIHIPAPAVPPVAPPPSPGSLPPVAPSAVPETAPPPPLGAVPPSPEAVKPATPPGVVPPVTPPVTLVPSAPPSVPVTPVSVNARVSDDATGLTPLPSLRPRTLSRPKAVLPLTGTFPVVMDGRTVTLPPEVLEQLAKCDTVLASPGSARCLWITNQAHLDRLGAKLDKSPAKEVDVQAFKRLYYAQITKLPVRDGKFTLTEKLAAFAGLGSEVVLVGIDDHFEVWDASSWRKFTAARKYAPAE